MCTCLKGCDDRLEVEEAWVHGMVKIPLQLSAEIRHGSGTTKTAEVLRFFRKKCPLGRVGLVVAMSICMLSPPHTIFFEASLAFRSHDQFQAFHWSTPPL